MATERVLNENLSGEEVLNSIVDNVRNHLRRDGFLNPAHSYEYYTAEITIRAKMHDVGRVAEVNQTITTELGQKPEPTEDEEFSEDSFLNQTEAAFKVEKAPPNEVRVASGQEVPVETMEKGRKVVKGIKYARKGAKVGERKSE